jgi:hypothetical protein
MQATASELSQQLHEVTDHRTTGFSYPVNGKLK